MHLVFSTKNRTAWITDDVREALHAYLASTLSNLGCTPMLINSVEDHVHLLFDLARTVSVSRCVEDLKKHPLSGSKRWRQNWRGLPGKQAMAFLPCRNPMLNL